MVAATDDFGHRGPLAHTYAEPLAGLRVSWGSVMAGAASFLAVSLLCFSLAFAIVMLAMHPTAGSLKGTIIALWICAIASTLVGAAVGGFVAGALPGNRRPAIGAAHGFIAWSVALVVSAILEVGGLGTILGMASNAATQSAAAVVQTVGSAATGAAGGNTPLDTRAQQALTSLGYTPEQASKMVSQAQGNVHQAIRGNAARDAGQQIQAGAAAVGRTLIDYGIAMGWTWFGTWLAALLLAVSGGSAGAARLSELDRRIEARHLRREPPVGPMTPVPGT